jgi:alanine-synthesizing transaminase
LNFSRRTSWHRQQNKLTTLYEHLLSQGRPIFDLTISNPTKCGFDYSSIVPLNISTSSLIYNPDPRGLLSARQSISRYYYENNVTVAPENIFLTSGSSEGYSHLFKLLCNPGDTVLVPRPSYPLFDYIAELNDVRLAHYNLNYDGEWQIDLDTISTALNESHTPVRAIIFVHPHNPTGMFLKLGEYRSIKDIAIKHGLALIVDEVFIDFPFNADERRLPSSVDEKDILTFTINGISKSFGLPQMKIGWIVVGGAAGMIVEATARLEIICDTFLSVNIPMQAILPDLIGGALVVRRQILDRIFSNYNFLVDAIGKNHSCTVLGTEGGWCGVLRIPSIKSDEQWSLELLENKGVYVQPGYFFDFPGEGYLVLGLLMAPPIFQKSIPAIVDYVSNV